MNNSKMFKCSCCGELLPETKEYFIWFDRKDENGNHHHSTCRKCEQEQLIDDNKKVLEDGTILYKCHVCGNWYTEDHFDVRDPERKTYSYRNGLDKRCKQCKRHQNKKAREEYDDSKKLQKVLQSRWLGARDRATSKIIDFTITKEDLSNLWESQNGLCAITKIPMTWELDNGRVFTNVSIDKIDPNKGYTLDNIQLVCMAINQMKSDMSMEELYKFCQAVLDNKPKE